MLYMRTCTSTADMSGHRWMLDERLCLDILHTEFENTKADNHDLFGRIFGQRWESADRNPYNAQRLYEEHRWRWNPAKSKDWDRICIPPTLRTGQQQAERDQMRQCILAAAAESGTKNYFTDEVDAPITLTTPAVAYVETGRPAGNKRKASKSAPSQPTPKRPAVAAAPSPNDITPSSSAVTTSSRPKPTPFPGPSKQRGRREAAGPSRSTSSRPQKKQSPTKRSTVKAGPDVDHPTHPSRSPEKTGEAPTPAVTNGTARTVQPETPPALQMAHSCLVDLSVFPPTYTQRNVSRFIPKDSRLYKYGGHVKRVVEGNKTFDVMVCTKSVCLFCQNYHRYANVSERCVKALAARAENADLMIPDDSPLGGLPFVHVWRDCDRDAEPNPGDRYTFSPIPPKPTNSPELPTWISKIAFDDSQNGTEKGDGCVGYRQAGLCDPFYCDVCRISDERAAELLSGQGPSAPA